MAGTAKEGKRFREKTRSPFHCKGGPKRAAKLLQVSRPGFGVRPEKVEDGGEG
jgi:hypothetical protein